jgi:DNA-binding transcriptional ArsR family regulator
VERAGVFLTDLTAPLGLSQPTVSHHLRILTEAGLLEREKRGVWAYYRLVPSAIAAIADLLTPPPQTGDEEDPLTGTVEDRRHAG